MVQVSIRSSLEAYMRMFHRHVTRHYVQSSQTFRHNPLSTPSLLLYSLADVVGTPRPIESLISEWRAGGVTVTRTAGRTRRTSDTIYTTRSPTRPLSTTSSTPSHLDTMMNTQSPSPPASSDLHSHQPPQTPGLFTAEILY